MEIDGLKKLLKTQRKHVEELESWVGTLEKQDLYDENTRLVEEGKVLKNQVKELKLMNEELDLMYRKGEVKYESLRSATLNYYKEMKASLLSKNMKKSIFYLKKEEEEGTIKLQSIWDRERERLEGLKKYIEKEVKGADHEMEKLLENTRETVIKRIKESKEKISEYSNIKEALHQEDYEELSRKEIPEEVIKEDLKDNNFELKFGTRWINIIGIAFIVCAIVLMAKYSYTKFFRSNEMKSILFYFIGVILLISGEVLNKKGKNYFSLSTTGGGVGILYISTAISHFHFGILSMYSALLMCILTTIVGMFLSVKYDAEIISILAVIGGYLPVLAMGRMDVTLIYSLLTYMMIFNISSYLISWKRQWLKPKFTNITLNFISLYYIIGWSGLRVVISFTVLMTYIFVSLTFYMFMILLTASPKRDDEMNRQMVLLVSLLAGMGIFAIIGLYGKEHLKGIFAIVMFIYYFSFGWALQQREEKQKTITLLYSVSLVFGILIIPLQFGVEYASLGWILEGTAILAYGITQKERRFIVIGAILVALATELIIIREGLTFFKHTLLTVSYLTTLFMLIRSRDYRLERALGNYTGVLEVVRIINTVNLCMYFYAFGYYLAKEIMFITYLDGINIGTLLLVVFNVSLSRIKVFEEKEWGPKRKVITTLSYLILIFLGQRVDMSVSNINLSGVLYILSLMSMLYYFYNLYRRPEIEHEHKDLIFNALGGFLVVNILVANRISSILFTCFLMGAAVSYLLYGFFRYNSKLRRAGLVLTIISIVKLFLFDLPRLNMMGKIVSYFFFGVILMLISYFYQYYVKKMELRIEEGAKDDRKD